MKPLLAKDLTTFLKRFDNFKGGEFRHIKVISPTTITVVFAVQDSAKEFNWININFKFNGVIDAKILDSSKLSLIDMDNGINFIYENSIFAFTLDNYNTISNIKNSTFYILCSSIKFQEDLF